jgi:hypothetical protein
MRLTRRIQQFVKGASAPNLVVAQRVIDKMTAAARKHMEDETGEAMIGLVSLPSLPNGVPTIYVLDTIAPDSSAVREFYTFQQGDDRQGDIFQWLYNNWENARERGRSGLGKLLPGTGKWDVPLCHLGDWHKQPGFMIHPSGGDLMTALDYLDDDGVSFLLAPIVTLGHPTTIVDADAISNFILVSNGDNTAIRIDFWYIDHHTDMFVPIIPAVYPDDQLPELAAYPWHILRESLAQEEFGFLQDDGLALSITHWNADGELPLEVCLLTTRLGADKRILLVLPHDYPARPPSARVASVAMGGHSEDMQAVFEKSWSVSQPLDLAWTAEKYPTLLTYMHALEDKAGIQRKVSEAPVVENAAEADAPAAETEKTP